MSPYNAGRGATRGRRGEEVTNMPLQQRIVNILTKPSEEWPLIAADTTDVGSLYRSYIVPLAAIGPVASFIGMTLVGVTVPFFGTVRQPVVTGLVGAVVSYVLTLAAVYVAAVVIDRLAPTFSSKPSTVQALKLVTYASTPAWLAGIFNLIRMLGVLAVLAGLYSIYLFYVGLAPLMETPADKRVPYMIVAAIVIIGIYAVAALITSAIAPTMPRSMLG